MLAMALDTEWNAPSEEELEEDKKEDELQATQEAERAQYFVHKTVLEVWHRGSWPHMIYWFVWQVAPTRPRPVMVCLSRDIAGFARDELISAFTRDFPGMYVRVDSSRYRLDTLHAIIARFSPKWIIVAPHKHYIATVLIPYWQELRI